MFQWLHNKSIPRWIDVNSEWTLKENIIILENCDFG